MPTKIEWCDEVWNPVTGCTKIRTGCTNCYAEGIAKRFWGNRKFTDVQCHSDRLEQPMHWRKPRKIFVCSMGDLFHEDVPFKFIDDVFSVMIQASHHKFILLTKRPQRMKEYFDSIYTDNERYDGFPLCKMLNHIWLGVSVSTQKDADEMIPVLLQIPATVRFVSMEPMLTKINISEDIQGFEHGNWHKKRPSLDWVICGCESGQNRRHIDIDRIRNLKNQCVEAGVPFFLKQMEINGKVVKMPELDGKVWNQYPDEK